MKTFAVEIEGRPPGLLMHKFSAATEAQLVDNVKKASKARLTPEEEAEAAAYRTEDGVLYQPAEHIYQALCKAAAQFRVKGQGKKTYKDAVKGNLLIDPAYIPHGTNDYGIDARPVRIQRSRIMRHRPHLARWNLAFTMQLIDAEAVPAEVLNSILVLAGEAIGIGDYRPRYGRFTVTSFKALA